MNDNSHRVWSLRRLSQRFSETQINNVATQPFSFPEVTRRTGPPDKSDELRIRKEYFAHAPKIGAGKGSRFLVLTKRNAASADENATQP